MLKIKGELRNFLDNLQQKHKLTYTNMYHLLQDEYARCSVKMCKEDK